MLNLKTLLFHCLVYKSFKNQLFYSKMLHKRGGGQKSAQKVLNGPSVNGTCSLNATFFRTEGCFIKRFFVKFAI